MMAAADLEGTTISSFSRCTYTPKSRKSNLSWKVPSVLTEKSCNMNDIPAMSLSSFNRKADAVILQMRFLVNDPHPQYEIPPLCPDCSSRLMPLPKPISIIHQKSFSEILVPRPFRSGAKLHKYFQCVPHPCKKSWPQPHFYSARCFSAAKDPF
jgi:hypothetical protein